MGLPPFLIGTQLTDLLGNFSNDLLELGTFGTADPANMEAAAVDTHKIHQPFHQQKAAAGKIISCREMAIPGVTSRHQNTIHPFLKGANHKLGIDSTGAGNPQHSGGGRIL